MAVQVSNSSRLNFTQLKLIEGVEFWDLVELPAYVPSVADMQYTIVEGDRLDILAHRFYQDSVLWWVIAWANDIELSPIGLFVGQTLTIPSPEYIANRLKKIRGL